MPLPALAPTFPSVAREFLAGTAGGGRFRRLESSDRPRLAAGDDRPAVAFHRRTKAVVRATGDRVTRSSPDGPPASLATASQLTTVNKDDLGELIGTQPREPVAKVSRGVGWFLQLES